MCEMMTDSLESIKFNVDLPNCEVGHIAEGNKICSGKAVARFYVSHARKSVLGCNNTLRVILDGLREGKVCDCGKPENDCLKIYPI